MTVTILYTIGYALIWFGVWFGAGVSLFMLLRWGRDE